MYWENRYIILAYEEHKAEVLVCQVRRESFFIPSHWYEVDGEIISPQFITECPRKAECEVGPNPSESDWERCPLPKAIQK